MFQEKKCIGTATPTSSDKGIYIFPLRFNFSPTKGTFSPESLSFSPHDISSLGYVMKCAAAFTVCGTVCPPQCTRIGLGFLSEQ